MPSASFRLRNGSLNAVRLRRVFDLFDRNGDGEITVDELAQALDALGLDADRAGLAATVGAYVPDGAAGLRLEDFDKLHRALGDAFFGALANQQAAAAAAGADGGKGAEEDEQEMREAFKVFNVDDDGFISPPSCRRCSRSWTPGGQQYGLGGRRSPAKSNLDATW